MRLWNKRVSVPARGFLIAVLFFQLQPVVFARQQTPGESKPIEDNSFLVEEAFNQEQGIVQHILMSTYDPLDESVYSSFTQEWPLFSDRHQLSYTLLHSASSLEAGIRALMVNYRYQLTERENGVVMAPRFSLILPVSGQTETNAPGIEINYPLSAPISESFILHANAGISVYPRVRKYIGPQFVTRTVMASGIGGSVIWLGGESWNILVEVMRYGASEIAANGQPGYSSTVAVNPGVRFAIEAGSVQIVPGVSVPFRWSGGRNGIGICAYLSFEHPFSER